MKAAGSFELTLELLQVDTVPRLIKLQTSVFPSSGIFTRQNPSETNNGLSHSFLRSEDMQSGRQAGSFNRLRLSRGFPIIVKRLSYIFVAK
jgi:hypothetical protein